MSRSVRRVGCRQVVKVDVRVQVRLTTSVECLNRSATWEGGRSERHGLFDNLRSFEILELELNLRLLPPHAPPVLDLVHLCRGNSHLHAASTRSWVSVLSSESSSHLLTVLVPFCPAEL